MFSNLKKWRSPFHKEVDENQTGFEKSEKPFDEQLYAEGGVPIDKKQIIKAKVEENSQTPAPTKKEVDEYVDAKLKERLAKAGEEIKSKKFWWHRLGNVVRAAVASVFLLNAVPAKTVEKTMESSADRKKFSLKIDEKNHEQTKSGDENEIFMIQKPNISVDLDWQKNQIKKNEIIRPAGLIERENYSEKKANLPPFALLVDWSGKYEAQKLDKEREKELEAYFIGALESLKSQVKEGARIDKIIVGIGGKVSPEGDFVKNLDLKLKRGDVAEKTIESFLKKKAAALGLDVIDVKIERNEDNSIKVEIDGKILDKFQVEDMMQTRFGLKTKQDVFDFIRAYNRGKVDQTKFSESDKELLKQIFEKNRGAELTISAVIAEPETYVEFEEELAQEKTVDYVVPKVNIKIDPAKKIKVEHNEISQKEEIKGKNETVEINLPFEQKEETQKEKYWEKDKAVHEIFGADRDGQGYYERPRKSTDSFDKKSEKKFEKMEITPNDPIQPIRPIKPIKPEKDVGGDEPAAIIRPTYVNPGKKNISKVVDSEAESAKAGSIMADFQNMARPTSKNEGVKITKGGKKTDYRQRVEFDEEGAIVPLAQNRDESQKLRVKTDERNRSKKKAEKHLRKRRQSVRKIKEQELN